MPVPKLEEGPAYAYTAPVLVYDGPPIPTVEEIEAKGYIRHVRLVLRSNMVFSTKQFPKHFCFSSETVVERTGGFRSILACQRALQEAMQGLFHGS